MRSTDQCARHEAADATRGAEQKLVAEAIAGCAGDEVEIEVHDLARSGREGAEIERVVCEESVGRTERGEALVEDLRAVFDDIEIQRCEAGAE